MNSISEIKKIFGITAFRASQENIIKNAIEGKNSLVIMPTGMGKSVCYQFRALAREGLTIVISPLIALMQDQVQKLLVLGIDAGFINSSLSKNERENKYQALREGKYKIIYISPERFRKNDFTESIKNRKIALLAVDEAHCISQWGHDFRPDYSRIADFLKILGGPPLMALTATATKTVQQDIIRQTGISENDMEVFNEGICRPNLFLSVNSFIDETDKFNAIIEQLRKNRGTAIVYFNLIKNIEKFSSLLDIQKIPHIYYHGRLPADKRKLVQKKFMQPQSTILLATNAFGMGIDKPDIRTIIHAELPASIEAWYQEIGRAGRDGNPSDCLVFYNQDDLTVLMDFIEWQNPDENFVKKVYRAMQDAGSGLCSLEYEDLQSRVVHKNRGDHRLQTVLNLFDRFNVTSGNMESRSLELVNELPEILTNADLIAERKKTSLERLYQMMQYVKTEKCRREYLYDYFGSFLPGCGKCDNCS